MKNQERTAIQNYNNWKRSAYENIWQAYEKPSYNKEKAWSYCKELCRRYAGFGLKVISKNTFVFTAGFEFVDLETGVLRFMYITPSYNTAVDVTTC